MSHQDKYLLVLLIVLLVAFVIIPIVILAININDYWDSNPDVYDV